jgi:hypothetical protein
MKRLFLLLAVIGFTVLPATAMAKVEKTTQFAQLSDVVTADTDQSGAGSPGDILTFTLTLFTKEGGKKIGSGHGYCVLAAEPFAVCTAVVKYAKGSIVVTWDDDNSKLSSRLAIVGGTRKYRHARGHATITQAGDATKFVIKSRVVF